MIVDDFIEWRIRLRSILEMILGFRVVADATNGVEAIEKAGRLLPDIVLLDVAMPLLNGIEAAPRIMLASSKSKIIFLTQEQDAEIRAEALATGAAAYLSKSTSMCELQRTIECAVLPDCASNLSSCQEVTAPMTEAPAVLSWAR